MADLKQKWQQNHPGKMFVDQSCIACDACVLTAPKHFAMHEEDGHAYVKSQPTTPEEEAECKEAMEGCPVEAIGDFGDQEGKV
jgi:ferredoxin